MSTNMKMMAWVWAAVLGIALGWTAAAPAAEFVLINSEHADITEYYDTGLLFDTSTAVVYAKGHIADVYIDDEALLRVMGDNYRGVGAATLYGAGRIAISSAHVDYLSAHDSSGVDISGGRVDCLYAYDSSGVNISGGDVGRLYAYHTSSVLLHGYDFRATDGLSLAGDLVVGTGLLAGRWHDGTQWIIPIRSQDSLATIRTVTVPEPATMALLGFGLVALLFGRRR